MLKKGITIAIIIYTVGIIGLHSAWRDLFIALTPFNLLATCGLLIFFHQPRDRSFWISAGIITALGFAVELLGVQTGHIFGEYSYGNPFGPKIGGTPPLIGVNWLILVYLGAQVCRRLSRFQWLNALAAALLITATDYLIEPVAISLGYWTWVADSIPVKNYLAWAVISFILVELLYRLNPRMENRIAPWLYLIMIAFFAVSNLLLVI